MTNVKRLLLLIGYICMRLSNFCCCRLSKEAKKDEAVRHALSVRAAVISGNCVPFFRLYKTAPNKNKGDR